MENLDWNSETKTGDVKDKLTCTYQILIPVRHSSKLKTTMKLELYNLVYIYYRCGRVVRDFESKQKLGVTFNFDKQDVIDFMKFSKMTMCRASEANTAFYQ